MFNQFLRNKRFVTMDRFLKFVKIKTKLQMGKKDRIKKTYANYTHCLDSQTKPK